MSSSLQLAVSDFAKVITNVDNKAICYRSNRLVDAVDLDLKARVAESTEKGNKADVSVTLYDYLLLGFC